MEATAAEKRTALRKMLEEPTCHLAPSCNDGSKPVWSNGSAFPSCIFPAAASTALWGSPMPGCLRSRKW